MTKKEKEREREKEIGMQEKILNYNSQHSGLLFMKAISILTFLITFIYLEATNIFNNSLPTIITVL